MKRNEDLLKPTSEEAIQWRESLERVLANSYPCPQVAAALVAGGFLACVMMNGSCLALLGHVTDSANAFSMRRPHADGLAAFRSFLRSEFSEENIEFWVACEDFKRTKSLMKMAAKAKKIYEDFIQAEGPKEVNIDHFTKDVTLRNLVDLSPSTFDLAQRRIYALMEKDSFGRFLRSDQYQELVK
ncbi:hypothetical protein JZ751_024949 [Albula glossodonta]|uniref:RGS domain-containing protein n=1 Tax=Albula glossodonta TaxID=121402 RepID=A0A8T2PFV7_9TELE|nr:hypothetical protein JZ751_024949 [Albula glossodonta]